MFLYTALYFYCFYVYVVFMVGILKQNGKKNVLKKIGSIICTYYNNNGE